MCMHVQLSMADLLEMELQVIGSLLSVGMWRWEVNSGSRKEQCTLVSWWTLSSPWTQALCLALEQLSHDVQNQLITVWSNEKDLTQDETFASALVFSRLLVNVVFLWCYSLCPFDSKRCRVLFSKRKSLPCEQKPTRAHSGFCCLSDQAKADASSRSDISQSLVKSLLTTTERNTGLSHKYPLPK